jgi:hypothetical protein
VHTFYHLYIYIAAGNPIIKRRGLGMPLTGLLRHVVCLSQTRTFQCHMSLSFLCAMSLDER